VTPPPVAKRPVRRRIAGVLGAVAAALLALPPALGAAATPPGASTAAATRVTPRSATLNGQVNPHGLPTTYHFDYGLTAAYTASTPAADAGTGTSGRHVSAPLAGLAPGTRYHFRLVAQSSAGVTRGADRVLRTRPGAQAVALRPSRNPVPFGATVAFTGAVTGASPSNRFVQLRQDPFPFAARGFANVASRVQTDLAGGFFIAGPALAVTTRFEVQVPGRPTVTSARVTVGVLARVGTSVTRTRVRRHRRVHFSGTLRPAELNRPMAIQRRRRGQWVTVAGMRTRPGRIAGTAVYGKTIRVSRPGLYRVLAGAGSGATLPNAGREIRMRIIG
jgi:hypothetical protein